MVHAEIASGGLLNGADVADADGAVCFNFPCAHEVCCSEEYHNACKDSGELGFFHDGHVGRIGSMEELGIMDFVVGHEVRALVMVWRRRARCPRHGGLVVLVRP